MGNNASSEGLDCSGASRRAAPEPDFFPAPKPDHTEDTLRALQQTVAALERQVALGLAKLEARTEPGAGATALAQGRQRDRDIDAPVTSNAIPMIIICDAGQDLDDEMAMIMARYLVEERLIDLRGVVASLTPAFDRARLCRGTLDCLGLHNVRVGIGSDGGDTEGQHKNSFVETARTYMPMVGTEAAINLEPACPMMHDLYTRAAPSSLVLLIVASIKDAALFVRDFEALFVAKTREVVIMGGAKALPGHVSRAMLEPDSAHNNCFDKAASAYFYRRCQELGVPLVVVSRHAAMAAQVPRTLYDELAETGSSIAWRLRNSQRDKIEELWQRACGTDAAVRRGLPARCDRAWFIKTFCGGMDDPERQGSDTVWDLIRAFQQYDSIAMLAAVPTIRERYFTPRRVQGPLKTNLLIGEETDPGLADPERLISLLKDGFLRGLTLNHKSRTHVVVLIQLREEITNHLSDVRIMLVTMRALWGIGVLDCAGILISRSRSEVTEGVASPSHGSSSAADSPEESCFVNRVAGQKYLGTAWAAGNTLLRHSSRSSEVLTHDTVLHKQAQEVAAMLAALGMSHVSVCVDDPFDTSTTSADWLHQLYEQAPPVGVTLILTSTAQQLTAFVREHADLFRAKTRSIVHMGGALVAVEHDEVDQERVASTRLEPDLEATNNLIDTDSVTQLYREAQRLSVPLTILSRYAARTCRVPARLFEALGEHAGVLGALLRDEQQDSLNKLWQRMHAPNRGGLPPRVNAQWFSKTFCNGKALDTLDEARSPWEHIDDIVLYNPLVLLAAIPAVEERFFSHTLVKVRSATHKVIGMHAQEGAGVRDGQLELLRELLYSLIFNGTTANASEFETSAGTATVALSAEPNGHKWSFNPGTALHVLEDALK